MKNRTCVNDVLVLVSPAGAVYIHRKRGQSTWIVWLSVGWLWKIIIIMVVKYNQAHVTECWWKSANRMNIDDDDEEKCCTQHVLPYYIIFWKENIYIYMFCNYEWILKMVFHEWDPWRSKDRGSLNCDEFYIRSSLGTYNGGKELWYTIEVGSVTKEI